MEKKKITDENVRLGKAEVLALEKQLPPLGTRYPYQLLLADVEAEIPRLGLSQRLPHELGPASIVELQRPHDRPVALLKPLRRILGERRPPEESVEDCRHSREQ